MQKSENILKPSILQFVESATAPSQAATGDSALSRTSGHPASKTSHSEAEIGRTDGELEFDMDQRDVSPPSLLASLTAKTRLIISLRIDKSRLALSCEPDNQVLADLAWDSGGFNLQCKPKAESIVGSVQVSSVAFHLYREIYQTRHVFVSGQLADLTASVVFRQGLRLPVLEAIVYTKVSADLNIKLLRQWFAFNSVWIERLSPIAKPPVSGASGVSNPAKPALPSRESTSSIFNRSRIGKIGKHVVMCLRLHEVALKANLDVSKVDVVIPIIDVRLAANDNMQRLSVAMDGLTMVGTKTISGKMINDGITFVAERKRIIRDDDYVTVMKLLIDSKDTVAELACIQQQVLGLQFVVLFLVTAQLAILTSLSLSISPTIVELQDDWQIQMKDGAPAEQKMGLAFKINLGHVNVMFAMLSLNALLDEAHSFLRRIEDEKREAEHSSAAYRHHLATKPKNAITAVAETVQKSRPAQLTCGMTGLSIDQRLTIETRRINLAIQATNEEKIYVFRLTPVQAKYRKIGDARHLEAEVETVRLTRDKAKDTAMLRDMKSVGEWLENKTGVTREEILSLPFIVSLRKASLLSVLIIACRQS